MTRVPGALMQTFRAQNYLGSRVRLTAWVRAAKAGAANIWMRVYGVDAMLAFDNMQNRQTRDAFAWPKEIVLDAPDDALIINFGLILNGGCQASEPVDSRFAAPACSSRPCGSGPF